MKKQVGAGAPLLASPPSPPGGAWFGWPAGLLGSAGPLILLLPIGGSPLSTLSPGWPPTAWLPPLWPLPHFAGLPPPWGASFSASGLLPSPLPLSPRRCPRRPRRRRARRWPPPAPAARPGVLGPLPESSPARSPPSGPSPPRPDPLPPRPVAAPSPPRLLLRSPPSPCSGPRRLRPPSAPWVAAGPPTLPPSSALGPAGGPLLLHRRLGPLAGARDGGFSPTPLGSCAHLGTRSAPISGGGRAVPAPRRSLRSPAFPSPLSSPLPFLTFSR
ncbi:putative basic proline-rich protein-like [Iris pallida]|uniref:Basic proline-rich protein-like n=1 Tax=Iris pallida TaxID=29817 RepID=A0AAX6F213_IRIPA|nr:putative basic proline-rich protein-like [Iris pallida]